MVTMVMAVHVQLAQLTVTLLYGQAVLLLSFTVHLVLLVIQLKEQQDKQLVQVPPCDNIYPHSAQKFRTPTLIMLIGRKFWPKFKPLLAKSPI